MFFGFIFLRVLFIACMVFVIGYVFGPFAKNRALTVITRVAAILAIVLFFATNALFFRFSSWRAGHHPGWHRGDSACVYQAPHREALQAFNGK